MKTIETEHDEKIFEEYLKASNEDLIIISDADEIPNPEKIINFDPNKKYGVFEQKQFYYKLNLFNESNPVWRGSKACIKKYLKSPQWLRELKIKKRPFWRLDKINLNYTIENGGWHFCNLKTPDQLLFKYKNLCEYKDNYVWDESHCFGFSIKSGEVVMNKYDYK